MRQKRSAAVIVSLILLTACGAFARRSYDRPFGAFKRADGTEVFIVRHYGGAGCFALVDGAERLHSALSFGLAGRERTNGAHL
jgi:hypothetical protein